MYIYTNHKNAQKTASFQALEILNLPTETSREILPHLVREVKGATLFDIYLFI